MIGKAVASLMGQAPQGQRKYIMGMVTVTGLLVIAGGCAVFSRGAAASDAAALQAIATSSIEAVRWVVGAIAVGLTGEHFAQAVKK